MKKKLLGSRPIIELKRVFKTEDSRFLLFSGFKVSGISFAISVLVYLFLFEVMRLNYVFFKAHGFPEFYEEDTFFDFILKEAVENLPVLFAFHIILFFIGVYIGWLILRPFRIIAEYSDKVIDNPNEVYRVEEFSTYKLLTRFSEFFFEYLRESRKKGEIITNSIPPQFSKIHKPVFDKIFMLHFGLLLIIVVISSAVFTIENSSAIFQNMVELATRTLTSNPSANKYLMNQMFILDDVIYLTVFFTVVAYLALGLHLYNKVSGAAFGIFSTMRSFMKGNYSSRVHLLGYAYVRDYTRRLNRYLEYMQNNYDKEKSKG